MPMHTVWPEVETFQDHSTWRPDWTPERICLYWYLTFEDQPEAASVAARAAGNLSRLPVIYQVPPRWLHLTLCDIGFLDQITTDQLEQLTDAVSVALRDQPHLSLTLGPVLPFDDAVTLAATPEDDLRQLWSRVADAMLSAGLAPEHHSLDAFRPHVTLGYLNRRTDTRTVWDALGDPSARESLTVDRLTLAAVGRRDGHYQWDCGAVISFGDDGEMLSTTGNDSTP